MARVKVIIAGAVCAIILAFIIGIGVGLTTSASTSTSTGIIIAGAVCAIILVIIVIVIVRLTNCDYTTLDTRRGKVIAVAFCVICLAINVIGIGVGLKYSAFTTLSTSTGFTAVPFPQENIIEFSPTNPGSYKWYTDILDIFIKPYEGARPGGNMIDCEEDTPNETQVCQFKNQWLDSCNKAQSWGFINSKPCVLLTYRNDSTYKPEPYDSPENLPSDMPADLKGEIQDNYENNDNMMDERVWVYCTHAFNYHPFQGLKIYNFPNKDVDGYLPPLVGVPFDLRNTNELDVECSLWSKTTGGAAVGKHSFKIRKTGA